MDAFEEAQAQRDAFIEEYWANPASPFHDYINGVGLWCDEGWEKEYALQVYLERKLPFLLRLAFPRRYRGIPVRVEVIGRFEIQ